MKKIRLLLDMSVTEESAGILFALDHVKEQVEVLGISLCFGRVSLESSRRSMGGLLELLGWNTEVALGAERPWRRDYMLPVSDEDVGQAINGLQIDTDRTWPVVSGEDGADFIYRKLSEQGGGKILCAGCLTNLAMLLERYPDAGELIEEIIWCGGTWRHAQLQMVKDYGTFLDPEAAQYVLERKIPLTMCPVDAGEICYLTKEEVDIHMYEKEPVLHQFNRLMKKRWCDANAELPLGQRRRPLPLQDMAAVAAAVAPELCGREMRYGEVDLEGRLTFGMLVIDINNRLNHRPEEMNIGQLAQIDREKAIRKFYMDK